MENKGNLFGRDSKNIRKHINNTLNEELHGEVVVSKFATTTQHGAIEENITCAKFARMGVDRDKLTATS